jgi:hypothetical protein
MISASSFMASSWREDTLGAENAFAVVDPFRAGV